MALWAEITAYAARAQHDPDNDSLRIAHLAGYANGGRVAIETRWRGESASHPPPVFTAVAAIATTRFRP